MSKKTSLKTILFISVAGVLFSGYLSYGELTRATCPIGGCTNVGPLPACVYGFVMYSIILIISAMGLKAKE